MGVGKGDLDNPLIDNKDVAAGGQNEYPLLIRLRRGAKAAIDLANDWSSPRHLSSQAGMKEARKACAEATSSHIRATPHDYHPSD